MATPTSQTYRTYIDLGDTSVRDIAEVVDSLRDLGAPSYDPLTHIVTVDYEIGPDGAADDLWDLRGVIEDIEANLSQWVPTPDIAKPVLVDPAAPPAAATWTFTNGDGPEWRVLHDYIEAHPYSMARIKGRDDSRHTGFIEQQTQSDGANKSTTIRVRKAGGTRGSRATVFSLDRLEIKVDGRYKPARDVLPV